MDAIRLRLAFFSSRQTLAFNHNMNTLLARRTESLLAGCAALASCSQIPVMRSAKAVDDRRVLPSSLDIDHTINGYRQSRAILRHNWPLLDGRKFLIAVWPAYCTGQQHAIRDRGTAARKLIWVCAEPEQV
jgi:hypothetical protein